MSSLPLGLSVPHAGLRVPGWLAPLCALTPEEVAADGDAGAARVYDLADRVGGFVSTDVARAIVDMNRPEDDRGKDGVVKTHTCWNVPVYRADLRAEGVERLLAEHHRPYHRALTALAGTVKLGVDCHTMAEVGPPVGPDPGVRRPLVCLGDGGGACPRPWLAALAECFARHFDGEVTVNRPFSGGYITRRHGEEMPWVQLELSRTSDLDDADKRRRVLAALGDWCRLDLADPRP